MRRLNITAPDSISPNMNIKSASDRLAAASLTLGILGWAIYLLQWCFDLTVGLILAVATAGAGAICSSVLDVLPFLLWVAGIITGHASLARFNATSDTGKARAV